VIITIDNNLYITVLCYSIILHFVNVFLLMTDTKAERKAVHALAPIKEI